MESFGHSFKTEMLYFMKFKYLLEAIAHIMDYITLHNKNGIHIGIGNMTWYRGSDVHSDIQTCSANGCQLNWVNIM